LQILRGHKDIVTSADLSADGRYALSGSRDGTVLLWEMDWELEAQIPCDWDEGARLCLETFLTLHTDLGFAEHEDRVSASGGPESKENSDPAKPDPKVGRPTWTEEDFQELMRQLQYSGYGWLRPEGVKRELEKMALEWQYPTELEAY
jgi:hypothetical protein